MWFCRLLAAVVCLAALGWAQSTWSVEQVTEFVRSSIQQKFSDRQIASQLTKVKLAQKLDDRTIEDLQGAGAGPKTVVALKDLREATAKLPDPPVKVAAPAPKPIPPPSYEEQQLVIEEVRDYALNYSKSLPDFVCTQVTRRFYDPSGTESWHVADTFNTKLTYFEQKENYQLVLVNNQMTNRKYESMEGTLSAGEFGSLLRYIFEPRSSAEFHWERWTTLRGHRAHVYNYHVEQGNSQYTVEFDKRLRIMPAYHGLIYVDKASNMVLRVTLDAELPSDFPVQEAKTRLDYDYQKISDREFLLPLVAEIRGRQGRVLTKNDVEFRLYHKYSADTVLTFDTDTPAPLPDEKTKEQPPPKQ